ncbi:MAG: NAD(P)H-dependent oxidoreductase [Desulfobulbaceae bacterium]|jgi:chromate reductase|nr:NAD(P)H-dependent oxidoreductase [Desulfobulbaceae bacterium]
MRQYSVALLVGSLRKDSFNRAVALAITKLAPADFVFKEVSIADLPLYNQDADGHEDAATLAFRREIAAADAVLFATPEYNRSMPGVLKNALDQGSRPYGKSVWSGKPAAVIGVSPGAMGTALAQQHLKNVLSFLNMPTLCQPEIFLQYKEGLLDANGDIGAASRGFLQGFIDAYVAWVKRHLA